MAGSSKRSKSCWTCRLRRKRCNRASPVCTSCAALDITCYATQSKPEWMDGGTREREIANLIRDQIKESRSSRRVKHAKPAKFVVTSQRDYTTKHGESNRLEHSAVSQISPSPAKAVLSADISSPSSTTNSDAAAAFQTADSARDVSSELLPDIAGSLVLFPSLGQAREMDFLMIYLDYVFPFLFPFYQPPLVGTSRAWLLSFPRQNSAVLHSILSLSSFFFTIGMKDVFPGKKLACKSVIWGQVVQQAKESFNMIQGDLAKIIGPSGNPSLLERARMMETIVHLLASELFTGGSGNWGIHLTPAIGLFEDILKEWPPERSKPGLTYVLEQMASAPPCYVGFEGSLWNSDQAAFRFFSATLLFLDIISSTPLKRAPLLKGLHSQVLADLAPEEIAGPLDLSAFIGCQNWALLAVGEIAALDEWKKDMKMSGRLSRLELMDRAYGISQVLEQGLARLEVPSETHGDETTTRRLQPYYRAQDPRRGTRLSGTPTKIWAYAARIYLSVVVSGWMPSDAQVRADVARALNLLQTVESAAQMRTFAWPICVAGCLAWGEAQRQEFESMITGAGDLQLLRTIDEAGRIMKTVWSRDDLDREDWDIAACLNVLGTPALLV